MPIHNAHSVHSRQRNVLDFSLSPAEESRRDEILGRAYLRIVEVFGCRPEPRAPWDRTADGTEKRWKKLLGPMRMAVASAVVTGDQAKIEKVLEASDAFCDELKADLRSLVPPREEESIVALAMDETQVEGPANEAEMALVKSPDCPITADKAVIPLSRQYERLGALIRKCRSTARQASPTMAARLR